jgi:hypothetical protein
MLRSVPYERYKSRWHAKLDEVGKKNFRPFNFNYLDDQTARISTAVRQNYAVQTVQREQFSRSIGKKILGKENKGDGYFPVT